MVARERLGVTDEGCPVGGREWYGVRCPGESAASFASRRREALRVAAYAAWLETLPGIKRRAPSKSTATEMFDRARALHGGARGCTKKQ